jgi:hypothetical protein
MVFLAGIMMKALGEADERKKEYTFIWHWQIMITSHQFVNELPLQDRPAASNKRLPGTPDAAKNIACGDCEIIW